MLITISDILCWSDSVVAYQKVLYLFESIFDYDCVVVTYVCMMKV